MSSTHHKQHIYIYSPSGAVADKAQVKRGIRRLQDLGHEVEVDVAAFDRSQRFAGDDQTRIDAIHRAAASGANIAMITRGGYGLTRILPGINYPAIAKAIDAGSQFLGFSDFTALQMALLAKTGVTTWAGPAVGEDFGTADAPDDIMQACFSEWAHGQAEGVGWKLPHKKEADASAQTSAPPPCEEIKNCMLWGGNLSVLSALVGTPYLPNVNNGILFIEDVHEHPYRVERMLTQLLYAGVLARQKAIVLGQFTHYKLAPNDRGFQLKTVVQWLRSKVKARVLTGLPFGHVPTKVVLPVGMKVNLLIQEREALVLWGHQGH